MVGATISTLIISPMYDVMEMKETSQTVIMRYHPFHIVIIIIMVLLLYFAKRVSVLAHTN